MIETHCVLESGKSNAAAKPAARYWAKIKQSGKVLRKQGPLKFLELSISSLIEPIRSARLRDAVATGEVGRLYVHSPDRLARKYAYQVMLVDECQRAGVEMVFLNRELGQSPEDELLLQVQGMIAEYERAKMLERSRRGKRHKAQQGSVNVLCGAPYGYRYVTLVEGGGQARAIEHRRGTAASDGRRPPDPTWQIVVGSHKHLGHAEEPHL